LKTKRGSDILLIGMQEDSAKRSFPARSLVKRFGAAGFVFFLVKGPVVADSPGRRRLLLA
jgi:hypothetical protein